MILAAAMLALAAPATNPKPVAPEAKPAWVGGIVKPDAADVAKQTYVVQPGDTLSRIVGKTGAGADAIAQANDLKPPFLVRPGQKLKIPAGRFHRVGRGEAGIAIARAYGVEWREIAELNHLEEPFVLREGQRLLIPSRKAVAAMTMEERARAFQIDLDDLVTGSEPAVGATAKPAKPVATPTRTLAPTIPVEPPKTAFAGRFVWPLSGRVVRMYGPMANGGRNQGLDIAGKSGQQIVAGADGTVAYAADYSSFGRVVLIRHGSGWLSLYAHVGDVLVKRGQAVKQGQPIAKVGGEELHFEVRNGKKAVNPVDLLPERAG